jgi:hypothetical protein
MTDNTTSGMNEKTSGMNENAAVSLRTNLIQNTHFVVRNEPWCPIHCITIFHKWHDKGLSGQ